jgi:2'-5' RNA ligase
MRSFIAIAIPEEIKRGMVDIQTRLKEAGLDASWPRPDGIHLTLKFLGEIEAEIIPKIMASLQKALTGIGPLRVGVRGVGTFPNPKNPRVVWTGVTGELEKLAAMQAAVEESMAGLGMEREPRLFVPHLTLCRVKSIRSRQRWTKALDAVKEVRFSDFVVTSVSLMKSELRPAGALYAEIGNIVL